MGRALSALDRTWRPAVPAASAARAASPVAHRPGLDGIRAVAVAAVVLFHLDRLPGGNLGVDAFFVLSGWLITWKLVDDAEQHGGRPRLRAFWAGRLRRLLPASLVVLLVVAVVWPLAGIRVPGLASDLRWAALWASNWGTITNGGDYWARFGEPSPITHFWSLAVEEQFYVVWPLVLAGVLGAARRRGRPFARSAVGGCALVLAGASVAYMNLRFDAAAPSATYLDTAARAHSLLLGAAAGALTVTLPSGRLRGGALARRLAPAAAAVAAAIVLVADEDSTWLFRWGFPAFAAAMVAVVVAAADGWGRVLGAGPLRWLGDRSYALYLWHWPVILFLDPARARVDGPLLDLLRVAVAVALAHLSLRLVESPVRSRRRLAGWRGPLAGAAALALVVLVVAPAARPTTGSVLAASVVTLPPLPSAAAGAAVAATSPLGATAGGGHEAAGSLGAAPPVAGVATPAGAGDRAAVAVADGAGGFGAPALRSLRRVPLDRPVRVLVAGDSTAMYLAHALLDHAAAHPDLLTVATAAYPGCGLTAAGDGRRHEYIDPSGKRTLVDLAGCTTAWDSLAGRVAGEQIDVVLLYVGLWDVVDIHLPDGSVVSVADAAGRRLVEEAYRRVTRTIVDSGAQVVYVRPTDVHPHWGRYGDEAAAEPRRWAALRSIVDDLRVAQVDLPSWLAVEGLDGPAGRPDGVHLTKEVNAVLVDELVAPMLLLVKAEHRAP